MIVNVKVKPGSKKGPTVQPNLVDESLLVYVREPAVDGKANRAIVELLADYFQVPKSRVTIMRGHTSRDKTIQIDRK